MPPTGRNLAAQGDLAGHGDVAAHEAPHGVRRERGDDRRAGRGPSLGMAPAGTCAWIVLPSNILGSMSKASALDHTYDTAAWALSGMTSPSMPASIRRSSLLGIMVTSTNRPTASAPGSD